ncbi:hypothetical protein GCM10010168_67710 [Actinoplanes ianthinogenes]|uniref:Uncharacterized protein n=1 Tax=Actinoplanes ianthinogenes TaxID=122358 RepID=A0ABN6CIK3_9ACTN|nr:hypothetical protein Aiant_46250 [Actinoplanes ianthinogenes]GGR39475.1 hypothetical protein GCM10010168_67710 [Actinoplanes ianthinogenes]
MRLEEVRHHPVALGDHLEVLTDVSRVHIGDRATGHPDGIGTDLVESGGASGGPRGHPPIVAYRAPGAAMTPQIAVDGAGRRSPG